MKLQKVIYIFFFLLLFNSASHAATSYDSMLFGTWALNGQPLYTFSKNGNGETAGEAFQWATDGGVLKFIEQDQIDEVTYKILGDKLTLSMNGMDIVLQKIGSASSGNSSGGSTAKKTIQKDISLSEAAVKSSEKNDTSIALNQLLLSSAWCSFSYNKISGATNTKRIQFSGNGTFTDNSRYEGYSSGYGGTMASQNEGSGLGKWKVENGMLFMAGPDFAMARINLQIKQNSNGYPIILADGIEYSQCQ